VVREYTDSPVLAIIAAKPAVFRAEFVAFAPRRSDARGSWRAMTEHGAWKVVNTTSRPVLATLEAKLSSWPWSQRLDTAIDGRPGPGALIPAGHHRCLIGPLSLLAGDSVLMFHTRPVTASDALAPPVGERRQPRALAIGTWRWWLAAPDEYPGGCRPVSPSDDAGPVPGLQSPP